jgi:hypothetical protein
MWEACEALDMPGLSEAEKPRPSAKSMPVWQRRRW